MPRAKSTGGSPVKKSAKSPARHTTPRKKSKTPSRKPAAKSPGRRGRSRSVSKSRATPKKSARKSPKSPKARATPKGRPRSRSRSTGRRTPTIGQKIQQTAQAIEHKVATPIASLASSLRSRRAAYDGAVSRLGAGSTTSAYTRRQPVGQSVWTRVKQSRPVQFVRSLPRRFRWINLKRHAKRNWRRYVLLAVAGAAAYYSYQNKKAIEKALAEQYNKLAALIEQQKGSTFSKYFSG